MYITHTLLDVIPRDFTAHARVSAYPLFPIASSLHVRLFGSTQGFKYTTFILGDERAS
jgi:hypothetical protein